MTDNKIPAMLAQQYEEGQLKGDHGVWTGEPLHMTWGEFEERSDCFYARLKRMTPMEYHSRAAEYQKLCMQYPEFARRYEAQRAKQTKERLTKKRK